MKSKAYVILLTLLFLASAADLQAQKVKVIFDKTQDFSRFKTYSWIKPGASAHPFLAMDVVGTIDQELQARGLKLVQSNADMLVGAYGSMDEQTSVSNLWDYYAAPGMEDSSPFAGPIMNTNTVMYIEKGTLVVDLADARAKRLVWRGTAKADLDPNKTMEALKAISNGVAKMFKQYPVKP